MALVITVLAASLGVSPLASTGAGDRPLSGKLTASEYRALLRHERLSKRSAKTD